MQKALETTMIKNDLIYSSLPYYFLNIDIVNVNDCGPLLRNNYEPTPKKCLS